MLKKISLECKYNYFLFLISILVILIAIAPLLRDACIDGHDVEYHLLRIESLKNGILIGKPFLKINTIFFNNAGYASSLFYPDILLYFPAILRAIGFSISVSYNLFLIFCVILCYINVYYCTKLIVKNSYSAIAASAIYTLCQYHIDDIYLRAAIGEISAFVFIPLLLFGIYDVLYNNFQKPWTMIAGFVGVMLCHTSTLLICTLFYFIFFSFHLKTFIKNPILIYKLIFAAIIVLSLTAFYLIPVIEQMTYDSFRFNRPWVIPSEHMVNIGTLFSNQFTGIGFIIWVLCFSRFFVPKEVKNIILINFADKCLLMGILFAFLTTNLFPWSKIDNYISILQFPWRMHIISSFCLALSVTIYFSSIFSNANYERYGLYIIVFAMGISAFITFSRIDIRYVALKDSYYYNIKNTAEVQAGEWLPLSVTDIDLVLNNSNKVATDSGKTLPFIREKNTILVDCIYDEKIDYIDVPYIYYKGYNAYLLHGEYEKPIKLNIAGNGNYGFCRVSVPVDCKGTILIKYDGTKIQNLSYLVTILTMISILCIIIRGATRHITCKYNKEPDINPSNPIFKSLFR